MASLDFDALAAPLDPDDPCGPDLELEDDQVFMQFTARAEQLMPAAFVQRDEKDGRIVLFDRSKIDFKAEFATAAALMERTRDLRLLAICCRLLALNRDLAGCARCLSAVASLLREHWEEVHPRGIDGDFSYRMAMLQVLDDGPSMVQPIQHLPLFAHRRFGPISYRTVLVARGRASAREDETALGPTELDRALGEADAAELAAMAEGAALLRTAARAVVEETMGRLGAQEAIRLKNLGELADGLLDFLGATQGAPEAAPGAPEAGPGDGPAATAGPAPAVLRPGAIAGPKAAAAALAAVSAYFAVHERSSPAALLVRQAARLIGLPFQEVIRTLLPRYAEEATLYIGPTPAKSFQLRLDRITESLGDEDEAPSGAEEDGTAPEAPVFAVRNRAEAVALLREVGGFYRTAEPSSPIPLFTDRACAMVNQDFLSILTDVLPGIRLHREDD